MAKEKSPEELAAKAEKDRLKAERKSLQQEEKMRKKEARKRAREIARREDDLAEEEEGNGLAAFGATLLIIALWLAVICIVVKLDIGGFGSTVLKPILKDVPVINLILPGDSQTETTDKESFGGYTSLQDAVKQIKELELQLERAQNEVAVNEEEIKVLKAEVLRLQEFEKKQVEFQRIRTEFYEEVIYASKGPGAEAYQKYYEAMDPTTAEYIYKQVIMQLEETKEIQEFAQTYAEMKPKQAAGIFEEMTTSLDLVARILRVMSAEDRGDILGVMDPEVAAKLTKILDPEA
ncbi:MAG: hypothetical protein IKL04_02990 [Lachnospiraceae bacterium]|nr:hypothetical protein [Lachnospiraceae bacterium]